MKLRRASCGCPAWFLTWRVTPKWLRGAWFWGFEWSGSIHFGFHKELA